MATADANQGDAGELRRKAGKMRGTVWWIGGGLAVDWRWIGVALTGLGVGTILVLQPNARRDDLVCFC
ncbi:MAG: hypothetical protein WD875_03240 [Pirellulales bacterium]